MSKITLKKSLNKIGNELLSSERDGFGYAVVGAQGIYGEKSVSSTFRSRFNNFNTVKLPFVKQQYSQFGTKADLTGPGIFHGRSSTNVISLLNTHPIQRDDWHLIHNGVVSDYGPKYQMMTQNDSEHVLHRLIAGISEVEAHLSGYYAFAAIDPKGQLHICRDAIAPLFVAWSESLDTYVFATTEELITRVNTMIGAKFGPTDMIHDDQYMVFEGNNLVHMQDIKSRGYTRQEAQYARTSLGRDLSGANSKADPWGFSGEGDMASEGGRDNRPLSEAEWNQVLSDASDVDNHIGEDDYYRYRRELDNLDASYTIFNTHDQQVELYEFYKMDHINQELCTVVRADGTVVDPDDYEGVKLVGAS